MSLQLAQPIFDGGQRRGVRRQREAIFEASTLSLEQAADRGAIRSAHRARRGRVARARARRARGRRRRRANEVLKITIVAFDAGSTTNIEVIDAQRSARDLEAVVALAEDAVRQARLDLLVALGRFPQLGATGTDEQLDFEDQRLVGADAAVGWRAVAVAQVRRNDDAAQAADPHADDALAETRESRSWPTVNGKRAGVEARALVVRPRRVIEPAGVIHGHVSADRRLRAGADAQIDGRERHVRRRGGRDAVRIAAAADARAPGPSQQRK